MRRASGLSLRASVLIETIRARFYLALCGIVAAAVTAMAMPAQSLPTIAGETLSGKRIVLADAVRGHTAVLVAGFSREGGAGTGDWVKALRADPALSGAAIFQIAQIAGAPGFMRGMIRNGMKKGLTRAQQDAFVVLTEDEKAWKNFFGVTTDKEPYVIVLNANGKVLWRGHGPAAKETEVRSAVK